MSSRQANNSLTLPYKWEPMPHQKAAWDYMLGGGKRAILLWSRRHGKDSTSINIASIKAHTHVGLYYYMAPEAKQARKILWDNISQTLGMRVVDQAFPKQLRDSTNENEMRIVLKNGSIFQIVGSDNYDSVMGTDPAGVVFSEWGLAKKPEAWKFISPVLARNGGWAIFNSTPRGMNHYYEQWNYAVANPDKWFTSCVTNADTHLISAEEEAEMVREHGIDHVRQELYCDWLANTERQLFDMDAAHCCTERAEPERKDTGAPLIMGVDVARFGKDKTCIVFRHGADLRSIPPVMLSGLDNVQVARAAQKLYEQYRPDVCFVDETGMPGAVDVMRRVMGVPARGINFGEKAEDPDRYFNKRAEMYGRFREWVRHPDSLLWQGKMGSTLREEMSAVEYTPDDRGYIKLPDKESIKKVLRRSPDLLDAVALTFAHNVPRPEVYALARARQAVVTW